MRIDPTPIPGVLLVEPDIHHDDRGAFYESWNRRRFTDFGLDQDFVQDNHSSSVRGVLRGIHYQDATSPLAKLVRCTAGEIWDVAVDLRPASPTYGQWYGVELTAANHRQLFVPVGCGHGFAALSDRAEVQYKCSGYYDPKAEGCILWNDADLHICWPFPAPLISPKDAAGRTWREYQRCPAFA